MAENVGAGSVVQSLALVDDGIGTALVHMSAISDIGAEMYEMDGEWAPQHCFSRSDMCPTFSGI